MLTLCYGEPQISQEYNYAGGLNINQLATDIDPRQSPDLCNCVSDPVGSAKPRNGTELVFSQAVSSYPSTSVYKIYAETSTEQALLFLNKNSVYYTTGGINSLVVESTDALSEYDDFKWLQMNNKGLLLGGHKNNIKEFDPINKTLKNLFDGVVASTSNGNTYVRAKHGLVLKNYLLLANVLVSTSSNFDTGISTAYPSRIYFSDLDKRSSFTVFNYIDFATGDGQEITGAGSLYGDAHFFKPNKILEVAFTVLDFTVDGDIVTDEIVNDFGLRASKSLVNSRLYYAFAADDGIRLWNGSKTSRLLPTDESRTISQDIHPLIDKLVRNDTYKKSAMIYYPKKEWLVFSYQDPDKNPKSALNSILVYDFKIGQWFPFCGISAQSFGLQNGGNDGGELIYGDNDGYLVEMDKYTRANDIRREMIVDVMDSSVPWVGSGVNTTNVLTGTASLRISVTDSVTESSMTRVTTFNFGEWQDKTKITRNDKLSFKAFANNLSSMTNLRVDLEVNAISGAFDNNFTSVTLSSAMFTGGEDGWTTFEIQLSSFPIRDDWVNFDSELIPFANTLFFYGIRFVMNGVFTSTVSIDDLRIVQGTSENPINFYRFTKLFDLQTKQEKNFGSMLLTLKKSPDSDLSIDVYNNFGSRVRTEKILAEVPKEIVVINYTTGSIAVLDSVDFTVKRSSVLSTSPNQFYQGFADKDYMWLNDRTNNRVLKIDRATFSVSATFGTLGSAATSFNLIHQSGANSDKMIFVDQVNQKIKQYNIRNNTFIRETGGLGTSTNTVSPKFHQPTAIAVNETTVFVADEGNYRWMRFNISTMGFELSDSIDYNTLGETTFALDEKYLYAAYISGVENNLTNSDVILEKREINNFELINRVSVKPEGTNAGAAYGHSGDIALLGKYLFIVFNDNEDNVTGANYYIQKRLKEDLSLVKEMIYPAQRIYSVLGDAYAYKPQTKTQTVDLKTDGRYIQLKYYANSLDNDFALYNQTFLVDPKSQGY